MTTTEATQLTAAQTEILVKGMSEARASAWNEAIEETVRVLLSPHFEARSIDDWVKHFRSRTPGEPMMTRIRALESELAAEKREHAATSRRFLDRMGRLEKAIARARKARNR